MGSVVRRAGFTLLVLCADEYQPPAESFSAVQVIYAPNHDIPDVGRKAAITAIHAAQAVAAAIKQGRSVLVTCWMGLNRSGLVSALALRLLRDWTPDQCIEIVQRSRPGALGNHVFRAAIRQLKVHLVEPERKTGIILASR